jgi:adenylate kinase family enzyme
LDRIHWKPGWIETPREEWAKVVADQAAGEQWVMDGNYGGTFEIRFERADTVIVLALSRWRCTSRALKRTLTHYGREVQAVGCPERLDFKFIRWVWRYPKDGRRHLHAALDSFDGRVRVIELLTPREVRRFPSDLGAVSH